MRSSYNFIFKDEEKTSQLGPHRSPCDQRMDSHFHQWISPLVCWWTMSAVTSVASFPLALSPADNPFGDGRSLAMERCGRRMVAFTYAPWEPCCPNNREPGNLCRRGNSVYFSSCFLVPQTSRCIVGTRLRLPKSFPLQSDLNI